LPSQRPFVPQLAAPWSEQREATSFSPAATLLHVPREAVSAHDLQTPVHADSQQMPCSQKFERHSPFARQMAPFGLRPHDPFTHTAGAWHWLSIVHDGRHASVPQVNGKQGRVAGVTQVPAPSQDDSGVNWWVAVGQVAALHGVPDGHRWQAPASHLPFVPQVDTSCTAHSPAGSIVPVATFVHTPSMPATHDLHGPSQAVWQQTPCAQTLLLHSLAVEHIAPSSFRPHEFAAQVLGVRHCVLLVQALKQREPLQT
jgi:hypothetical protein